MNQYTYDEARQVIKSGDIIFVKGRPHDIIEKVIMKATRSKFSHVCVAFWVNECNGDFSRLLVVEAQGNTSRRITNLSFYADRDLVVVKAPKQWNDVRELALDKVSRASYGYIDALWVGTREWSQRVLRLNLPKFDFEGETCSEFVARLYDMDDVVVSPQKLYSNLIHSGATTFNVNK